MTAVHTTEVAAQQAAELAAIERMLGISRGTFSLSFAVCNSPALRDYLIGKLKESSPGISVVALTKDATDPYGFVASRMESERPAALCVTGIEQLVPSESPVQPAVKSLNASRELWAERFSCPVIFWLPEYAARILSIHAPDFWRYRSHRFEFVSEFGVIVTEFMSLPFGDRASFSNLDKNDKHVRIAELMRRIAEASDASNPNLSSHVLAWLDELAVLYFKLGMTEYAERAWQEMEFLARQFESEVDLAIALTGIGNVRRLQGRLDEAEAAYREALSIDEKLERRMSISAILGNLGVINLERGDLNSSEQMLLRALEIDEETGNLDGMANHYSNLGVLFDVRGDLEAAEGMHRKALEIENKLGRLEGIASDSANIGIVMQKRGDYKGAEEMYKRALEIDENLGELHGVAVHHSNLASVMAECGRVGEARDQWTKSQEIYRLLGAQHMVERVQGWLDGLAD